MSVYNGMSDSLHTRLTNLLMEHGAAVTKQSVNELIKFINQRDYDTTQKIRADVARVYRQLEADTLVNDLVVKSPEATDE